MRELYEVHGAYEVNGQWIGRTMLIEALTKETALMRYTNIHKDYPVQIEQIYRVEVEVVSREQV